MFGDAGHGLVMALFAATLVRFEKYLDKHEVGGEVRGEEGWGWRRGEGGVGGGGGGEVEERCGVEERWGWRRGEG